MNTAVRLLLATFLAGQCSPVYAQYHYRSGNARVTVQSQTGLYRPAGTYIGGGTLSQSAQGKNAGMGGALPSVPLGSHVRTAGDNMYNNDGSERTETGALIYKDQQPALYRQSMVRQAMSSQPQKRTQQQNGYYYVPGSNGAAASYGGMPPAQIQFNRSGTATYGSGGYTGKPATRF